MPKGARAKGSIDAPEYSNYKPMKDKLNIPRSTRIMTEHGAAALQERYDHNGRYYLPILAI
jgi:hypothetical protein